MEFDTEDQVLLVLISHFKNIFIFVRAFKDTYSVNYKLINDIMNEASKKSKEHEIIKDKILLDRPGTNSSPTGNLIM